MKYAISNVSNYVRNCRLVTVGGSAGTNADDGGRQHLSNELGPSQNMSRTSAASEAAALPHNRARPVYGSPDEIVALMAGLAIDLPALDFIPDDDDEDCY